MSENGSSHDLADKHDIADTRIFRIPVLSITLVIITIAVLVHFLSSASFSRKVFNRNSAPFGYQFRFGFLFALIKKTI
jgi:hypothetical protein